jgi:benzylsuccinate CoA-transferase BbsF subunit
VKILDFGWVVAGPAGTRVLGLLGATVVKVESNTHLDSTRASTPFFGRPSRDRSGMFSQHNNNKLSLSLDLNKPKSRPVVERLVRWADVACENFTAGRMEAWKLGYDDLRRWNPDLIMLRSSTWGQDGPYMAIPANGTVLGGFAGYIHLTGWPDLPPVAPGDPYTDMIAPWYGASAIIAALIARGRGAGGRLLDLAHLDCALNFLGPELARASRGERAGRLGPFHWDPYPAGVFRGPGDEEWCALSVLDDAQWRAVCALVPGLAGAADRPPAALREIAPYVSASLAAYFLSAPSSATVRALQLAGVPAAKVAKPEDLFDDPQLNHRGHFVELPHPSMGKFAYELPSFRYRDRAIVLTRSPLIGEHNVHVLGALLGYSEDEIADLVAEEIVN